MSICVECEESEPRPGSYWCSERCKAAYEQAVALGQTPPLVDLPPPAVVNGVVDWTALPLGRVSDLQIARQIGRSPRSVAKARERLGIPPAMTHYHPVSKHDWDAQPLGQVPDRVIAERLGCKEWTVSHHRLKRGIPSWAETQRAKQLQAKPTDGEGTDATDH